MKTSNAAASLASTVSPFSPALLADVVETPTAEESNPREQLIGSRRRRRHRLRDEHRAVTPAYGFSTEWLVSSHQIEGFPRDIGLSRYFPKYTSSENDLINSVRKTRPIPPVRGYYKCIWRYR